MRKFGLRDVREIKTRDFQEYIEDLSRKRPDLTPSTKNTILATFRNVLKVARDDGVIHSMPDTPRTSRKTILVHFSVSILSCLHMRTLS
jgi:hypothetical protein